jgi:hypothetical protein
MDGTVLDLTLFLSATFAAALVAGLAGFAFGLVAAAVWLHVLTPLQTAMRSSSQHCLDSTPGVRNYTCPLRGKAVQPILDDQDETMDREARGRSDWNTLSHPNRRKKCSRSQI